jgi:hypothetical protein
LCILGADIVSDSVPAIFLVLSNIDIVLGFKALVIIRLLWWASFLDANLGDPSTALICLLIDPTFGLISEIMVGSSNDPFLDIIDYQ